MTIVTLGIDLGKNLNSVVGLDEEGQVVLRRRVRRATLTELAGKLSPCTVAMEAWLAERIMSAVSLPRRATRSG